MSQLCNTYAFCASWSRLIAVLYTENSDAFPLVYQSKYNAIFFLNDQNGEEHSGICVRFLQTCVLSDFYTFMCTCKYVCFTKYDRQKKHNTYDFMSKKFFFLFYAIRGIDILKRK